MGWALDGDEGGVEDDSDGKAWGYEDKNGCEYGGEVKLEMGIKWTKIW